MLFIFKIKIMKRKKIQEDEEDDNNNKRMKFTENLKKRKFEDNNTNIFIENKKIKIMSKEEEIIENLYNENIKYKEIIENLYNENIKLNNIIQEYLSKPYQQYIGIVN